MVEVTKIPATILLLYTNQTPEYYNCESSLLSDSTVLAYMLKLLNDRYDYGVKLVLLSVDEGITGYRDDSLEVGLAVWSRGI